jgi:transcriptional regulator with XRE-family HTH domain
MGMVDLSPGATSTTILGDRAFTLAPSFMRSPFLTLNTSEVKSSHWADEYTAWVRIPYAVPPASSGISVLVRDVRRLTKWSQRDMAGLLGVSHTTIRKLETEGRVTARTREAASKVRSIHGVIVRLAKVARTPEALSVLLASEDAVEGELLGLLRAGEYPKALLLGLRRLNGPRPSMLSLGDDRPMLPATRELT